MYTFITLIHRNARAFTQTRKIKKIVIWMEWCTPVISTLGRMRQNDGSNQGQPRLDSETLHMPIN